MYTHIEYEAAGKHWQSLERLEVIESDEVERMVGEHALVKIQRYVSGCAGTFKKYAVQYQFDQAERQLALLKMLANQFPNVDLKVSLEELEALLTQCKERKAEEQRNTDKELGAAKRKVRIEMEQKTQQMMAQMENMMEQMNISENERNRMRKMANEARREVLEGIVKN